MLREEIKNLVEKAIKQLYKTEVDVKIDHPENKEYGDYSTNIAFLLAKTVKKSPFDIAEEIKSQITNSKLQTSHKSEIFKKIETTAGFINFFISEEYLQKQVIEILKEKNKYGGLKIGKGEKINVEFISANPTGPLTLGNGRGGFCGDVLANILQSAGYKTIREYYINDAGEQVRKLGHSVLGDEEAVYKGKYIEDLRLNPPASLREALRAGIKDPEAVGEKAAKIILEEMIKPEVKKMGIKFNVWFSEKTLHEKGEVKKVIELLSDKGLTYEKERASWFKSTEFGDDKDRVLIKADGETTYLTSDVAYLKDKFSRGFGKLIFFWGADHFGYIERLKAAAIALGYKKEQIDIIIMQLVKLFEGGKEVKMSKRSGIYVSMDELIDEVGLDAARFFFLSRAANTHLDFDMDLAKEQSDKNPVYYVQYAHARIHSILAKSQFPISNFQTNSKYLNFLNHKSELNLIKQLIRLPEIIEDTAVDYQVQRLPQYAVDLATAFHAFYRDCKVICTDKNLEQARISLVTAAQIALQNTLSLMGISAPERM